MKYKKIALIFGITGQDGSYLSEYLLKKKYKVIGVVKKIKPNRNHKILKIDKKIKFQKCNYNQEQIEKIIKVSKCTEIYYLAGQPLPTISKKEFLETLNSNIYPVYYILNAILNINNKIKSIFLIIDFVISKNILWVLNYKKILILIFLLKFLKELINTIYLLTQIRKK